jgi:hypothetical protein
LVRPSQEAIAEDAARRYDLIKERLMMEIKHLLPGA